LRLHGIASSAALTTLTANRIGQHRLERLRGRLRQPITHRTPSTLTGASDVNVCCRSFHSGATPAFARPLWSLRAVGDRRGRRSPRPCSLCTIDRPPRISRGKSPRRRLSGRLQVDNQSVRSPCGRHRKTWLTRASSGFCSSERPFTSLQLGEGVQRERAHESCRRFLGSMSQSAVLPRHDIGTQERTGTITTKLNLFAPRRS
jgi:hypothetical protein